MRCALKNFIILVAVCGLAGILVSCNKDSGSSSSSSGNSGGAIAMVDPDRVTEAIGWNQEVRKNLEQAQTEARRQIEAHIEPSKTAFERKKAEVFAAAKLTPEQIQSLNTKRTTRAEMVAIGLSNQQIDDLLASGSVWQTELSNAQSAMQQAMARQNQAIQAAFRDALSPIIRQVAKDRGRVAVFMPTQAVWFDSSVDITDDVVKEIQKRPSVKLTLPEMPKLEWAASQPTTGPAAPTTMPSGPAVIAPPPTQPGPQSKP
jgi:Skp family chaperone for outer membrane proteins